MHDSLDYSVCSLTKFTHYYVVLEWHTCQISLQFYCIHTKYKISSNPQKQQQKQMFHHLNNFNSTLQNLKYADMGIQLKVQKGINFVFLIFSDYESFLFIGYCMISDLVAQTLILGFDLIYDFIRFKSFCNYLLMQSPHSQLRRSPNNRNNKEENPEQEHKFIAEKHRALDSNFPRSASMGGGRIKNQKNLSNRSSSPILNLNGKHKRDSSKGVPFVLADGSLNSKINQGIKPIIAPYPTQQTQNHDENFQIELERWKKMYKPDGTDQFIYKIFYSMIEELNIKHEKQNEEDFIELGKLLYALRYPSMDLAHLHHKANLLGQLDLIGTKELLNHIICPNFCKCCQLPIQKSLIPLWTDIQQVQRLGFSTYLFFHSFKSIISFLFVFLVVLCFFAIITNVIASFKYQNILDQDVQNKFNSYYWFLATSIGSKYFLKDNASQTQIIIQSWLGFFCVVFCGVLLLVIKVFELRKAAYFKKKEVSISNYTLSFSNLQDEISAKYLERYLQKYQNQIKMKQPQLLKELMSVTIQVKQLVRVGIFDLHQIIEKNQDLIKKREQMNKCKKIIQNIVFHRQITNRFSRDQIERQNQIKILTQAREQYFQSTERFLQQQFQKKVYQQFLNQDLKHYFVVFKRTQNKQLIQRLHENQSSFILNLPWLKQNQYFTQNLPEQFSKITIEQAPEPEDIIWKNLGTTNCERKSLKIFTFLIVFFLLSISFVMTMIITHLQIEYARDFQMKGKKIIGTLLSLIKSVLILIINYINSEIFRSLTKRQNNPTKSLDQISICKKMVATTLINIIVLPIAVNAFSNTNLFGIGGLSDQVLSLAISNVIVGPFMICLDLTVISKKVKFLFRDPLKMNQIQLNTMVEPPDFQIGHSYANVISIFLYTCFFLSLQPLIVPVTMFGLVLLYMAYKYSLLRNRRKPTTSKEEIHEELIQIIQLGPIFYSIGSFLWTNIVTQTFVDSLPNILSFLASIIIYLIPYRFFGKKLTEDIKPYRIASYFDQQSQFKYSNYKNSNPFYEEYKTTIKGKMFSQRQQKRQKRQKRQKPKIEQDNGLHLHVMKEQQCQKSEQSEQSKNIYHIKKTRRDEDQETIKPTINNLNKYYYKMYKQQQKKPMQKKKQFFNEINYQQFQQGKQNRKANRGQYWFQKKKI